MTGILDVGDGLAGPRRVPAHSPVREIAAGCFDAEHFAGRILNETARCETREDERRSVATASEE